MEYLKANSVLLNQCIMKKVFAEQTQGIREFLLADAVVATQTVCKARVWRGQDEGGPAYFPCLKKCDSDVGYCLKHRKKRDVSGSPTYGHWDPEVAHASLSVLKRRKNMPFAFALGCSKAPRGCCNLFAWK